MAKLYKITFYEKSKAKGGEAQAVRWCATRQEAELIRGAHRANPGAAAAEGRANPGAAAAEGRANPGGRGSELIQGGASELIEVEIDELELRQAAVNWLNRSEKMRLIAKKREANKTSEQKKEIMRKVWEKRKANQN